jgi:hypothetical protein
MYSFDNISLKQDNKRWFPVMGEIHYSRYPHEYWRESLLKMKAGGVDVASTYVIWIHHEEIEDEYDFSGDRDLRLFVQTCKECKIKLWLRIGPWVHAEVRNGGFPDWLLKKDFKVRTNDERYFAIIEKWYKKIYEQVQGLFYSDAEPDNPIIGVQIENEFGHCGGLYDESGEIHMQRLTKMAKEIGFTVPFYSATGWGGARTGGLIPVMGGYCDAPWDPRTTEIEPSGNYIFTYERNDHNIGSDFGLGEGITFAQEKFPYLTAELGGGLQMTKHRRTVATAKDIGAVSLVKIGSGVKLLGYYMYHGGTNPDGKLTSLEESKATGSLNDLPEKSYDFNAPVREYGQLAPVYKELKLLFYFVHDFGSELCELPALIPEDNPLKPENLSDLRYAFRTDGKRGYAFINNYVRLKKMPVHKKVELKLPDEKTRLPLMDINPDEYFFVPFNMCFGGVKILSAECSPLCMLPDGTVVFYAREYSERKNAFFNFEKEEAMKKNPSIKYLVLSRENALNAWKFKNHLIISENPVIPQTKASALISGRGECSFSVYPDFNKAPNGFEKCGVENLNLAEDLPPVEFSVYRSTKKIVQPYSKEISFNLIQTSEDKKSYKLSLSKLVDSFITEQKQAELSDCFIKINYLGESARLYALQKGKKVLIADNYFSGIEYTWEIGLKRFINTDISFENLELELFTLHSSDKIYFEKPIDFTEKNLCSLISVNTEYEWTLLLKD